MSVFSALKFGTLWRIVSEVNIEEIRADVERTFHLLIVADDEADASELGAFISDEAGAFVHPWITPQATPVQISTAGLERINIAILLSRSVELSEALKQAYRDLASVRIPTLIVVFGAAAHQPSAAVARRGEEDRIVVSNLDAAAVREHVGKGLIQIASADLELALPRRLPPLRPAAFNLLINKTSQVNATYSFSTGLAELIPALNIPLNVGDLIVLSKNQLVMSYKIALIAGKTGTPQELLGEIMSVLGGGFLFRQLARQLVGLIPAWGIAPKVAIAYAGTWTIGQAAVLWAVEGQKVTPELLRQFYNEALLRGQAAAQRMTQEMRSRLPAPAPLSNNDEPLWQKMRKKLPFTRR
jgi:uncharacterized protein (DUF697 family)